MDRPITLSTPCRCRMSVPSQMIKTHLVNSTGPHDDGLVRQPLPLPTEGVEAQAVQAEGPEEGEPAEEEAALALGPGLVRDEEDEESGDKSH